MSPRESFWTWVATRLLLAVSVALLVAALLAVNADAAPAVCHEDAPCWNWRTMGNGTRGVVTLAGRFKVVDGRHFDELRRVKRIDWTRSACLRGDR